VLQEVSYLNFWVSLQFYKSVESSLSALPLEERKHRWFELIYGLIKEDSMDWLRKVTLPSGDTISIDSLDHMLRIFEDDRESYPDKYREKKKIKRVYFCNRRKDQSSAKWFEVHTGQHVVDVTVNGERHQLHTGSRATALLFLDLVFRVFCKRKCRPIENSHGEWKECRRFFNVPLFDGELPYDEDRFNFICPLPLKKGILNEIDLYKDISRDTHSLTGDNLLSIHENPSSYTPVVDSCSSMVDKNSVSCGDMWLPLTEENIKRQEEVYQKADQKQLDDKMGDVVKIDSLLDWLGNIIPDSESTEIFLEPCDASSPASPKKRKRGEYEGILISI